MKLNEIINSQNELKTLARCESLDAVTAFAVAKNIQTLDEEIKLYNEARQKAVLKYAKTGDDGNPEVESGHYVFKSDDDEKDFIDEVTELLNSESEAKIKKIDIEKLSGWNVSPAQMIKIMYMIEDEK